MTRQEYNQYWQIKLRLLSDPAMLDLEMKVYWSFETSVVIYRSTRREILEDLESLFHILFFSLGATTLCDFFACSVLLDHTSLSIATLLQFWTFIFPKSCLTSFSRLNHHQQIFLTIIDLHSDILFTFLSSSIPTIRPIHLILCDLICLTTYSLILILQTPYSLLLGFTSSLLLFFQTLSIDARVFHINLLAPELFFLF